MYIQMLYLRMVSKYFVLYKFLNTLKPKRDSSLCASPVWFPEIQGLCDIAYSFHSRLKYLALESDKDIKLFAIPS